MAEDRIGSTRDHLLGGPLGDELERDGTPRAIVDVSDPERSTIVALNVPAEFSAAALGLAVGQSIDPLILADPATRDEATAKFGRLMAGEIAEYQTYGTILDVWGDPVALRFTVRLRPDVAAGGPHLEVAWHDVNLPEVSDGAVDALTLTSDAAAGFSALDLAQLAQLADFATPVLEVVAVRRTAGSLLETYLGNARYIAGVLVGHRGMKLISVHRVVLRMYSCWRRA